MAKKSLQPNRQGIHPLATKQRPMNGARVAGITRIAGFIRRWRLARSLMTGRWWPGMGLVLIITITAACNTLVPPPPPTPEPTATPFWMLGNDIFRKSWPTAGEIDIMEHIGREPETAHGTIHGPGYSGGDGITTSRNLGEPLADDFHVFAIEWEPEEIRWYMDDVLYHTVTSADLPEEAEWVFDHPFFLLLNVAVGGRWPGYPDETTEFPQRMLVDYVRVYTVISNQ